MSLPTNAVKYGALSVPGGVVHIDCSVTGNELHLTWKERGGPPIEGRPGSEGFGTVLTRRIVSSHFDGRLSSQWERERLMARLSIPIEQLKA